MVKFPKDDERYRWTEHVKQKMIQYRISAALIKRVINSPKRKEEGIALGTIAAMQPTQTRKQQEIWVMYKIAKSEKLKAKNLGRKLKIISAWRYPGISPMGKPIPIPADILEELENL